MLTMTVIEEKSPYRAPFLCEADEACETMDAMIVL
jgi:hypothetical protein